MRPKDAKKTEARIWFLASVLVTILVVHTGHALASALAAYGVGYWSSRSFDD